MQERCAAERYVQESKRAVADGNPLKWTLVHEKPSADEIERADDALEKSLKAALQKPSNARIRAWLRRIGRRNDECSQTMGTGVSQ
ncbi:MAG: hypothetical protein AAFX94_11745, partial [Myxococcota bacterium]